MNDEEANEGQQQQMLDDERRYEEESAAMLRSLGASYQPCAKHPAHEVYQDRTGRQNWLQCPDCLADAKERYNDQPIGVEAAWGSDHRIVGDTLYTRATGGYFVYSSGEEPKGLK